MNLSIFRRSRIVIVSQSNRAHNYRNFDTFRRGRMRRGIVVSYGSRIVVES